MIPAQHPTDAGQARAGPLFSICTLVTRHAEYAAMLESFAARGFTADKAEFLYLDNSNAHHWDAFHAFYLATVEKKWAHDYLTRDFWKFPSDQIPG